MVRRIGTLGFVWFCFFSCSAHLTAREVGVLKTPDGVMGTFFRYRQLIITAWHVVEGQPEGRFELIEEGKRRVAELKFVRYRESDVAYSGKLEGELFVPFTTGFISIIGCPIGIEDQRIYGKGQRIANYHQVLKQPLIDWVQDRQILLLSVPTEEGYSGSPILNEDGELVGILIAGSKTLSFGVCPTRSSSTQNQEERKEADSPQEQESLQETDVPLSVLLGVHPQIIKVNTTLSDLVFKPIILWR